MKHSILLAPVLGLLLLASTARAEGDSPEAVPQLFESSYAYELKGDYDRALNDTIRILRVTPDDYVANYRAGWLYYMKGRYSDSIKYYKKASSIAPRAAEPKLALVLTLIAARQWAPMESLGHELLKRWPTDYTVRSRMAYAYFSAGKFKQSEQLYQDLVADYPSDLEMLTGLGWTYLKLNNKAKAREAFDRVLMIRRDHARAKAGRDAAR